MTFSNVFIIILVSLAFVQIECADNKYEVFINEVNINDPRKPERREFIELRSTSKNSITLQGYKLIGISGGVHADAVPVIELVITLWNQHINANGFFTVGGSDVNGADLRIPSGYIKFRNNFITGTITNFLINGNKNINAIGLLYGRQESFRDIVLTKQKNHIPLDGKMKALLKQHLVDMVVYSKMYDSNRCDIYEEIYPQFVGRKYVLREFNAVDVDYTLNRCASESLGFRPEKFKIGKPTPGADNDCSGAHYIVEDRILDIMPSINTHVLYPADHEQPPVSYEPCCSTNIERTEYYMHSSDKILLSIQTESEAAQADACTPHMLNPYGGNIAHQIDQANNRKRRISAIRDYSEEFEWKTNKYFKPEWIEQMETHQTHLLPIELIKSQKSWFEYLINEGDPKNSRYRCRLCAKYSEEFGFPSENANEFASKDGLLKPLKRSNEDAIKEHPFTGEHRNIVQILEERKLGEMENDFRQIEALDETVDDNILQVTARMFRTVYVEVKKNILFEAHPDLITLQTMNGVDMGAHHMGKKDTVNIMQFMSLSMHRALIDELLADNVPISLLIDSITDGSDQQYFVVYFQTTEEYSSTIYFYKVIVAPTQATGSAYFKRLSESFQEDGPDVYTYLQNHLYGFASEGSTQMMDRVSGVIAYIRNKFATNAVYAVHLMPHKLHTTLINAFQTNYYFLEFEDWINDVYVFYNSHGQKRKAHLRATSEMLGARMIDLKYIYTDELVTSNVNAMNDIQKMWYSLVTDLSQISSDDTFDSKTRYRAKDLRNKLLGKNFLLIFNFVLDILKHLDFWSRIMQEKVTLLIEFADVNSKIMDALEAMKTNAGKELNVFLNERTFCTVDKITTNCYTLETYEKSSEITYFGETLIDDHTIYRVPLLGDIRQSLLDAIIYQIRLYFPSGDPIVLNTFSPEHFPANGEHASTYGLTEIESMCVFYGWENCAELQTEWTDVVRSILESPEICDFRNKDTSVQAFWAQFLRNENVRWTTKVRKFVQIILALPIGNAKICRGHSLMSRLLTSSQNMDFYKIIDVMRIQLNGPDQLERFGAPKYAAAWINAHNMRTDGPEPKRPRPSNMDDEENATKRYLEPSTLF